MIELTFFVELVFKITEYFELMTFVVEWSDDDANDDDALHETTLLFHKIDECVMVACIDGSNVVQYKIEVDDQIIFISVFGITV